VATVSPSGDGNAPAPHRGGDHRACLLIIVPGLASEATGFPHEVWEMALAHGIANKAEAAYRRGDLFEKRRKLMNAWAGYCATPKSAKVIAP
jgi:hypothetical protein